MVGGSPGSLKVVVCFITAESHKIYNSQPGSAKPKGIYTAISHFHRDHTQDKRVSDKDLYLGCTLQKRINNNFLNNSYFHNYAS